MAFDVPPIQMLPVSKGGDIIIDFMQKIDNQYTEYGPGVIVQLQIDIPETVSATATISTYHAVCKIESTVADTIPNGSLWRCIVSYPTFPTTEVVGMNGRVKRFDGA